MATVFEKAEYTAAVKAIQMFGQDCELADKELAVGANDYAFKFKATVGAEEHYFLMQGKVYRHPINGAVDMLARTLTELDAAGNIVNEVKLGVGTRLKYRGGKILVESIVSRKARH